MNLPTRVTRGGAHLENRFFCLVEVLDLLELLSRIHLDGAELEHRKEVLAQPHHLLDKKTRLMARAIRAMKEPKKRHAH